MKRYALALGLLLVAGFAVLVIHQMSHPNRFVVRNSAGSVVSDLGLTAATRDGKILLNRTRTRIPSGEGWTIRHRHNDSFLRLHFTLNGVEHDFASGYLDLWRGEGWVLDIQRDGTVRDARLSMR